MPDTLWPVRACGSKEKKPVTLMQMKDRIHLLEGKPTHNRIGMKPAPIRCREWGREAVDRVGLDQDVDR
jgi:hypothetical protein